MLLAAMTPSHAASITWTNTAGGFWNTPANWSPNRVPGASDTAVITIGGVSNQPLLVTLDVSPTVGGLTLGATGNCGGGQVLRINGQTLTLDGPAVVNACGQLTIDSGAFAGTPNASISGAIGWTGGILSGWLALATNGTLNIMGANDHDMPNCVFMNYGTVAWSGGRVRGGGGNTGTRVHNMGLWDAQSDEVFNGEFGGAGLVFTNTGTLRKSAGINTTTLAAGTTFINNGTVEVESGTLAFMNGGVFVTGSVLSRGGLVQLKAGTFMIGAATVTSTNVQLVGGTLSGVIRGVLDWVAGDWDGGVTIASNSVLNIVSGNDHNMANCGLTSYGTVVWSGGRLRGGGGNGTQVSNFGLWDAQSDQVFNADFGGAGVVFNNAGTLRKSAGINTTALLSRVGFVNTGTVEVDSGALAFYGGGNFNGGSVNSPGGVVQLAAGGFTLNGTVTCANVQLVGGTLAGNNVIRGAFDWVVGDWNGAEGV
ncbi:MAG TPA: hypothetical protein VEO53_13110, partial [Candidatus Binatia bacterium]|nr:hypothetical protein [Candidatus Binatia bacterium]